MRNFVGNYHDSLGYPRTGHLGSQVMPPLPPPKHACGTQSSRGARLPLLLATTERPAQLLFFFLLFLLGSYVLCCPTAAHFYHYGRLAATSCRATPPTSRPASSPPFRTTALHPCPRRPLEILHCPAGGAIATRPPSSTTRLHCRD